MTERQKKFLLNLERTILYGIIVVVAISPLTPLGRAFFGVVASALCATFLTTTVATLTLIIINDRDI